MAKRKMSAPEVGPRIRLAMSGLTEKERQIARYCLGLGTSIASVSVHDVARANDVSAAMIVKLAQRLGFSGFKEMKEALWAYHQLPTVDLHRELGPEDDAVTVVEKVFKTAIQALQDTLQVIDVSQLEAAAAALRKAPSITVVGVGGSAAIALDFHHKLLRIGIRTFFTCDSHAMAMAASVLEPGAVVLGVSHSGRTHAILETFRIAKERGATTILLTNTPNSPTSRLADFLLVSVAQGSPITGENAAARIAQLNILDVLFVLVAKESYIESLENLERTIGAVSSMRV